MVLSSAAEDSAVDALSTQDIGVGIILAVLLAALAVFLQEQSRSSFPNMVLWATRDSTDNGTPKDAFMEADDDDAETIISLSSNNATAGVENATNNSNTTSGNIVFNGTNWSEMSRPENYIWYSRSITDNDSKKSTRQSMSWDNRIALWALVALFVPIFGVELFLALSRQFVCESGSSGSLAWAQDFCAPIYDAYKGPS
ncbi:expressed unknown protein [Seminavis robusta]|uniref:Uncharacterized protein n=1 Tax=Seminavis robusta TaxID=568900 RepID=A0A9N8HGH3_9STRA|nr:expressed unknown protein [Seminavis robusta]|eukprot:Sro484_g152340.1 n/a (199) ;mRNA; f:63381-63977